MPKFDHLSALSGHFETELSALPADIQEVVRDAYWAGDLGGDWDTLTPLQRIDLAFQYDTPETDVVRYNHLEELRREHQEVDSLQCNTVTEAEQKRLRLDNLVTRFRATQANLLQDQLFRAQALNATSDAEHEWQRWKVEVITKAMAMAAEGKPSFDPESPLPCNTEQEPKYQKRWTPEALAPLKAYRESHTMPETATKFGISEQRIRQLLPREKPKPSPFSGLGNRKN